MAGRTFKLKDASSTGYGTLTEATATAGTMGSGWTVGTSTANAFSTMLYGTTRAAATFTTGVDQLSTQANFATGQAWRTDIPIDGTFSSGTNWSLAFSMIAVSTAASQTGRIKVRIWKSSDPVGATANQIQLTIATAAGLVTGTTAAFTKATAGVSTVTWTPTGIPAFSNEYLFVSTEWNTVAAGTRAGCDAIFGATSASVIITSDFTPRTVQATNSDSLTLAETRTGLRTTRSTAVDSLVLVDTRTGIKLANATASDTLVFVDASTAARITRGTAAESLTLAETRTGLRTTVSTGSDSITLADSATGARKTQIFVSDSLTLSDTRSFISAGVTGAISESITFSDTRNATVTTAPSPPIVYDRSNIVSSEQLICLPISPPVSLGIGALCQLPCLFPPHWIHDRHDGGWIKKPKTKKYQSPIELRLREERRVRDDLVKALREKSRPEGLRRKKSVPVRVLPEPQPERPPPQPVSITPVLPIPSQTDYAGLAKAQLLANMPEILRQKQQHLESRWTPEEREEEKELEMLLEHL